MVDRIPTTANVTEKDERLAPTLARLSESVEEYFKKKHHLKLGDNLESGSGSDLVQSPNRVIVISYNLRGTYDNVHIRSSKIDRNETKSKPFKQEAIANFVYERPDLRFLDLRKSQSAGFGVTLEWLEEVERAIQEVAT